MGLFQCYIVLKASVVYIGAERRVCATFKINIVCTGRPLGPRLHRKVRIVCAYTVENAL